MGYTKVPIKDDLPSLKRLVFLHINWFTLSQSRYKLERLKIQNCPMIIGVIINKNKENNVFKDGIGV